MGELVIREASKDDASAIALLLGQLGYPRSVSFVEDKVSTLSHNESDSVVVAELRGEVVAVAHLHLASLFHESGHLGRVTAIVVTENCRRMGIGRELMATLEVAAERAGCTKIEVTSGLKRDSAHAFYARLGYCEKPKRFLKLLR